MLINYLNPLLKPILKPIFFNFKTPIRKFTPCRALLYVPANDLRKVLKAFLLDIDIIALDCEDGVASNQKEQARYNIREMLDKGKPEKKRRYDFAVRVNGFSSGLTKTDLSAVITGKNLPDTILLPKVETPDDIKMFSDILNKFIQVEAKIRLIIMIESALALINIVDICKKAKEISQSSKFTPAALLFGSDDYCANIGARRSESSFEVTYARQKIVAVARAFDLQAIDMVYVKYKDLEGLKIQAEEGARLGYSGKQVIHPGQVEITQKAFMPTDKEVAWASGVLKAFNKHQKEGKGAFIYKDNMIDMPTMKQAQNIMDLVNALMMQE